MPNQPIKSSVDYENYFSNELWNIIQYINDGILQELNRNYICPEIFVIASIQKTESMLYKCANSFINTFQLDNIRDYLIMYVNANPENGGMIDTTGGSEYKYSKEMKMMFSKADGERKQLGNKYITTDHVLLAILSDENVISNAFKTEGLTYSVLRNQCESIHEITDTVEKKQPAKKSAIRRKIITPFGVMEAVEMIGGSQDSQATQPESGGIGYCTCLNKLSEEGLIDPIIGREDVMEEIVNVLNRRKSNNVILVGKPGVGTSHIVEGIADMIAKSSSHYTFRNLKIYKVNFNEMMSGTQFRGIFEERMNNVLNSLREDGNSVLFIDDLDTMVSDKGKDEYNLSQLLSDALTDGTIKVIATSSQKGYSNMMRYNKSFVKKFQRINVDEPSIEDTVKILEGVKGSYEEFHNVSYTEKAICACAELCKRYINDTSLPSSALSIMDMAGSRKKSDDPYMKEYMQKKEYLTNLEKKRDSEMQSTERSNLEPINNEINGIRTQLSIINDKMAEKYTFIITENDIRSTISLHTGIPVDRISTDDKKKLMQISEKMKERIVGQDEAIEKVAKVIKKSKLGFTPSHQPIASFLCIGSTGTGKTLMAKTLAREIFGDEKYLIRFDMSEYSDKTSVNKLIGSSAGYVGYDNGGLLTEAVKNKKYAVLLIDEIEKANEDVYNLFLQVLDEGFLTDNSGERVDFSNTIIIMTSNIGAKEAQEKRKIGFSSETDDATEDIIKKEMKKKFPPEFINRITNIVFFRKLSDDDIRKIIEIELGYVNERIAKSGYSFTYDGGVVDYILGKATQEKEYGARPIIRVIDSEIEDRIVDYILEEGMDGGKIIVENKDGSIAIGR